MSVDDINSWVQVCGGVAGPAIAAVALGVQVRQRSAVGLGRSEENGADAGGRLSALADAASTDMERTLRPKRRSYKAIVAALFGVMALLGGITTAAVSRTGGDVSDDALGVLVYVALAFLLGFRARRDMRLDPGRRGRWMARTGLISAAVAALIAVGALAEPTNDPPLSSDQQVLDEYFGNRYIACQNGLTPEAPDCNRVLDTGSQDEWLTRYGYPDCRARGQAPNECVLLLPSG
jgi:hypothetical protein